MKNRKLNVLIIAHELSPYSGSECAIGWNLVKRLASYHNITVLYASGSHARPFSYVNGVDQYFQQNPLIEGLKLINVNHPQFTRFIACVNSVFSKIGPTGLPALYYLGYRVWQKKAYRMAIDLHKRFSFNAVHQITQITYREPGYLWKLGIPFFWGPTGGVANMSWSFYKNLSFGSKIIEGVRFLSNKYQTCCMRRIKTAISRSSVIYAYSHEDIQFFSKGSLGQIRQMLDVGTSLVKNKSHNYIENKEVLEGVWCGHLTYRKAPEIALKALAAGKLTMQRMRLTIIGEGPLEKDLLELAVRLHLNNIRWIRKIPHDQVFELMQEADFLIHTSLREATSSVIPEALSVGLPVICHDANGMGIAVNETCGIKVPLISPEASVNGFHNAIKNLILNHDYLTSLKKGALKRSEELSWDNMAATIAYDYSTVVGGFAIE